jgi:hypothetical protein
MLYSKKALNFLAFYEILTRPKLAYLCLFRREDQRCQDRRIPRVGLQEYSGLAFKRLFDSDDSQSLLNVCSHDHASFQSIIELFQPIYDSHYLNDYTGFIAPVSTTRTGKRKGRPSHLDAEGCLGFVLVMWYSTRGAVSMSLCINQLCYAG